MATNNEVQVKVAQAGATVVLSNAVVFTSGRPALDVAQNASLKMAGGTSYLAATNSVVAPIGVSAVTVAKGAELAVDLAPNANWKEAMIGVFNFGIESAISGGGSTSVKGGTLFVWSDNWAAPNGMCDPGEIVQAGDTPEEMRYMTLDWQFKRCVLFGPAVTVTVTGLQHVTDVTVSNAVQVIEKAPFIAGTDIYHVMAGDDIFVGYTVEPGCTLKSENPLIFPAIEDDVVVNADTIRILPHIPYRAWNAEKGQMEDRECSDYIVVTNETATFEDDKWYVVKDTVECGSIAVNGAAHLILCDGTTLAANALTGGSLAVHGQAENGGALVVSGAVGTALTVVGGNVKAGSVTTRAKNAMGEDVYCVTAEVEKLKVEELKVMGLEDYGITGIRLTDGKVYLWLPNGTHYFTLSVTLSDETTYYCYCVEVNGADITVRPVARPEPVTPGEPSKSYTTAEEATNAANRAVLVPTEKVLEVLETDEAIMTYCNLFGFAVTGGGTAWFVKSVLTPEAWTNVTESAQAATRQIDVAGIAALATDGKKDVTVTNCVPGFYYTLYGAQGLSALPTTETKYGPELSGVSGEVTFPQVVKPSDAAGFFSVGARETPGVQPSDRADHYTSVRGRIMPPAVRGAETRQTASVRRRSVCVNRGRFFVRGGGRM